MKATKLVKSVFKDVTSHWKRPAEGNFVSYKEIVNLGLGGMGNNFTMVLVGYMGLNAGNTLLGSTIGIRPLHLQYMLTVQTILNVLFFFVRAHIVDNTRTKWGRFRPYIAFMGIPLAIMSVIFVFLPFQTMSYNDKLICVFVFAITISMVQPLFTDTYTELQTVITPNSEERAKVISINSIIFSAAPTITGLFVPILSNMTGGYTNINTYRYVLAPVTLLGLGLNFFTAIGCKERVVTSSSYVQKVGIIEGTFMILKNKHWWIRQIAGLIGFLESATGVFFGWIYIYGVQDMTSYGILNTVMGTASGIAMAITPFLLKKLGNRKLLIYHNLINVFLLAILMFTFKVPTIMFIIMYMNSLINALSIVNSDGYKNKYSLDVMLKEFLYLTVDDMIFDIDNDLMEHKGKTVKFSFAVTDEYLKSYKEKFGESSAFEGSKYATMEFAYDRFASIVIYAEEKIGSVITTDKEVYKLETVYYGPIVNIPSYDNSEW